MTSAGSLSGFLLIDKPAGLSSFDVIRQLRKQTSVRVFGHAGTLDPFATGLMILAYNKYTRLLTLLDNAEKEYRATMILGTQTSSGDPEGEVVAVSEQVVTAGQVDDVKEQVLQIKSLKPPLHSAVKVDGKRSYARARANEEFDLPEREAKVFEFEIIDFDYPKLTYTCRVSKGTYIRSLSQFIAQVLNTVGYTKELSRTAIGGITLKQANRLDALTADTLADLSTPVYEFFPHLETLTLTAEKLLVIRNGNPVSNDGTNNPQVLIFDEQRVCRGIAMRQDNILRPKVNL